MKLFVALLALVAAVSAKQDPRCPPRDGAMPLYFRDSEDCAVFFQCSNGAAYRFDCPQGTVFDTTLNVCNWPFAVDCEEGSGGSGDEEDDVPVVPIEPVEPVEPVEPEPEPEPKPEPKPEPEPEKPDDDASLNAQCKDVPYNVLVQIPHPTDCTKFYKCAQGKAWIQSCPSNLHYNRDERVCDYPESAGCEELLKA